MSPTRAVRYQSAPLYQAVDALNREQTPCSIRHKNPTDCCKAELAKLAQEVSQLPVAELDAAFARVATKLHQIFLSNVCDYARKTFLPRACTSMPQQVKYLVAGRSEGEPLAHTQNQLENDLHDCRQSILASFSEITGQFLSQDSLMIGAQQGVKYKMEHVGDIFLSLDCSLVEPSQLLAVSVPQILCLDSYLIRHHYLLEELYAMSLSGGISGYLKAAAATLTPAALGLAAGATWPFALLAGGLGGVLASMYNNKVGIYEPLPAEVGFQPLSDYVPELEFGLDPRSSGPLGRAVGTMWWLAGYQEAPSKTCGYLRLRLDRETPVTDCPSFRVDLRNAQAIHPNHVWILRELIRERFFAGKLAFERIPALCAALRLPIVTSKFPEKPLVDLFAATSIDSLIPVCLNAVIPGNDQIKSKIKAALNRPDSFGRAYIDYRQLF